MKKYIKPEIESIGVLSEEIMNVTSNLDMGGTTDSFDAVIRQTIEDEIDTGKDFEIENLW